MTSFLDSARRPRHRRREPSAARGRPASAARDAALWIALVAAGLVIAPMAAHAGDALVPEAWSQLLWSVARVLRLLLNLPADNECPC